MRMGHCEMAGFQGISNSMRPGTLNRTPLIMEKVFKRMSTRETLFSRTLAQLGRIRRNQPSKSKLLRNNRRLWMIWKKVRKLISGSVELY
jgi:hypothetical protein